MYKLLLMLFAFSSFAHSAETYLWSDSKGVIEAESCNISFQSTSTFKLVASGDKKVLDIQAHDGDFNYEVYSGSLVKVLSDTQPQSLIEIQSYQGEQDPDGKLIAARGTRGNISQSHLVSLLDRVLTVEGESHRILSDEFESEHIKLIATTNNKDFKIAKCQLSEGQKARTYQLFEVRDARTLAKVGEIGVDIEGATLMAHTHSDSQAFSLEESLPQFGAEKFNIFSYVVCSEDESVEVFNSNHSLVIFNAKSGETIVPFQTFDGSSSKVLKDQKGRKKIYQKVKFLDRTDPNNVGWILREYVQLTSECPYIEIPEDEEDDDDDTPQDQQTCSFPVVKRPTHPYDSGMRRFGANRGSGTRLHAANDLYRNRNDAVVAVQGGRVIRALYPFYEGTYAIEVKHDNGKVVRYGEITSKTPAGGNLAVGARVSRKDIVGFIGKVNSGCCNPMLHFELYSGKGNGRLSDSNSGTRYKRRWDLLDPTSFLKDWEKSSPWK